MLGDEIVDSTSVNLQIASPAPDFASERTRQSSPSPIEEHPSPPARGSIVEKKTIGMSAGHALKKRFPELQPTTLNQSDPQRLPRKKAPSVPSAKGSQVGRLRVKARESQPAPTRVKRMSSQPVAQVSLPTGKLAQISSDMADPELASGARLGNYEIVRKIGQSGMGVVYEARHLLLPRRE